MLTYWHFDTSSDLLSFIFWNTIYSGSWSLSVCNFIMAVANTPLPVMPDKYREDLKLQLCRHAGILLFTLINLMHLIIQVLWRELKKIIVSEFFFQIQQLFTFYWYWNYKQIGSWYTSRSMLVHEVAAFKTVPKLHQDYKYQYLDHKKVWW